jgi:hypothetical protein
VAAAGTAPINAIATRSCTKPTLDRPPFCIGKSGKYESVDDE